MFHLIILLACKNNNINFNENGIYAAFFNYSNNGYFVGLGNGKLLFLDSLMKIEREIIFSKSKQNIIDLRTYSPDNLLVNTTENGAVYVWKIFESKIFETSKFVLHHKKSINACISNDGKYLASTGMDSLLYIIERKNPNSIKKIKLKYGVVYFIWFTSDNSYLLFGDSEGYFYKLNLKKWNYKFLKITNNSIYCVNSDLYNKLILISCSDGSTKLMDFINFKTIQNFQSHKGGTYVSEFISDKLFASTGHDGFIKLWGLREGEFKLIKKIKAHDGPCCTLYYNDDKTKLLSGGQDGWLKLWDVNTLDLLNSKNIYE